MKALANYIPLIIILMILSCDSTQEKQVRIQREEQHRIELAEKQKEEVRLRVEQLEKERKEKEIYDKYINNSLPNGSTPFAYCYGGNKGCSEYGCSQIKVRTPYNSDVLVTIKKNDIVVRHAYIKAGNSFIFEIPNGTYQPFFYYGKGWNPDKFIKKTSCGDLKGGFISDEHFGKDTPQSLTNNILEYELILQENGNFSTKPSNQNEAL